MTQTGHKMKDGTTGGYHAGLAEVRERIRKALVEAGRKEDEVTLIAVSKTFGPEAIRPVLEAGQRHFGENRVQEAAGKWPDLRERFADVTLHLIGPLQTNKARQAVGLFDAIHTVDRPKLARELAKEMKKQGRSLQLFVQVNTGEEPQKAGVRPAEADAFIRQCHEEFGLEISGLMCIPPFVRDPEASRPHFRRLAVLRDGLEQALGRALPGLSMGMSHDFEVAVEEGATVVRVGTAIFGPRRES